MNKKALVIGEDTRSFLSVIRSLGKKKYTVDVVCFDAKSPSLCSKYISNVHLLNYQAYTQHQWLESLLELCKNNQYDVLVPCDERSIFPLFENQTRFPSNIKLAIPNQSVIEHLFDKTTTKSLALSLDVPVARGEILKIKKHRYEDLKAQFGSVFVVKPMLSFTSSNLATRQTVGVIEDQSTFVEYTKYIENNDEFLVEEFFVGNGDGLSILAINGEVLEAFAHTRVNEPRTGGGSSYRKAIPIDSQKLQACERICRATNYTGVGMFEFKTNSQTGKWILIEVNARFWGSIPLAIHAGIDFPAKYIEALLNSKPRQVGINTTYNTNAYARSLSSDLFDSKAEFEYDKQHKGTIVAIKNLGLRLCSFVRTLNNEKIDSYDQNDKQPFIAECKLFFDSTFGERLNRAKTVNQAQQLQGLLTYLYTSPRPSIKFVCYGNIMRSPMAKESLSLLCEQVKLDWDVDSFGFHQNEKRASPIECIEEAAKLGIDLRNHRSKCLRQTHLDSESSVIFVFDDKNMDKIDRYYKAEHVYNLAWFIPQGLGRHKEITDPYGKGNNATAFCYLLIVEAIKNIFEAYLKIKNT
jgi:protein-tyrosine-phosphatase/predicted ATP-grasp superfamily ATP-dependent carboligase